MSDELGHLIQHEADDLMQDFNQVTAKLQVWRSHGVHLPPALGLLFAHVESEAHCVEELVQVLFVIGLMQGAKGKALDDYTKCDCC